LTFCPVCGNENSCTEFTCYDFFVTGESFPVLKCLKCGFRWTGLVPDPEKIGRYYQSEEYISHSNSTRGLVNRVYHIIRSFMLKRKLGIVRRVSDRSAGILLDIGAGTGYFLQFMKQNGWQVTGTEKSEKAREFASVQWQLDILPDEGLFALPDNSFDVITLWHVLEHLHHPEKYLEKAGNLLKPSGCLIIALPNPRSFDAGHYGKYWAAWDVPRHLWHFLPENVEQLAGKSGFFLKNMYRMPFDAFYVSILSEKYRKSGVSTFKGLFYGQISWMISLIRMQKCSSLIYVFNRCQ
jgi:2-polyprenyl-3-methyl-5-hydroxy-6-metoxy-1,4-benzoquinol methylase